MSIPRPLISTGNIRKDALKGKVAIVTGAGSGIGFEAARSLLLLGAKVIIAEIDSVKGEEAALILASELGQDCVRFKRTDVGKEEDIGHLATFAFQEFGKVDIVLNNAAVEPIGAPVWSTAVGDWDLSYHVNLRGPVMLARTFIPKMLERGYGVFVCVPSSGAMPFMGPYEVFKTAQAELGNTLAAELEHKCVHCFSIGPGLVRTEGALQGIEKIAPLYGKSVQEFFEMGNAQLLTAEAAGAGFAAAIAMAERYRGQEIGSIQALIDAGIEVDRGEQGSAAPDEPMMIEAKEATKLASNIHRTLLEQSNGWKNRPRFEQMWVQRDFKRHMGMPVESALEKLSSLERALKEDRFHEVQKIGAPLAKLIEYYEHLAKLQLGYEKNPVKREKGYLEIYEWIKAVERLEELLKRMKG